MVTKTQVWLSCCCLSICCSGASHVSQLATSLDTYTSAAAKCAAEPIRASGTKYFFCDCKAGADAACQSGNEANDGLSIANPKQLFTTAAKTFQSMSAGDTILFCKGGSFDAAAESRWVNARCTKSNTCDVRDYVDTRNGHSDPSAKPIIKAISSDTGQSAIFDFDDGAWAHEEGYRFLNLDIEHGLDTAYRAFLPTKDVSDVFICNNTINGFPGVPLQNETSCSSGCPAGTPPGNDRLTVRGNLFTNNYIPILSSGYSTVIEYNYFDNNGNGDIRNHGAVYLQGFSWNGAAVASTNEVVRGNEAYHNNQGSLSPGHCNATIFDAHGRHDNLLAEGNIISEVSGTANAGCWGFGYDTGGYSAAEGFTNLIIRNNAIFNVGNTSIGTMECINCIIESNLIVQDSATIQGSSNGGAINVPNKGRSGVPSGSFTTTGMAIRNNTIYFANGNGIAISVNSDGATGTGNIITNNAIMVNGSTTPFSCFALNQPAGSYYMDHNDCYFPIPAAAKWEASSGGTLAAWQSFSGLDAHSITTNPLFTNPAAPAYDFTTQATSPLRGGGDPGPGKFAPLDILGKARPSPPDIGAFQH